MKTNTKHTPERWEYRAGTSPHYQGQIYREGTGETVAISFNDEGGHIAALCASAPELLEALKELFGLYVVLPEPIDEHLRERHRRALYDARAAIAKAEGGIS